MVLQVWSNKDQENTAGTLSKRVNQTNNVVDTIRTMSPSPIHIQSPTSEQPISPEPGAKEKRKKGLLNIKSPFKFMGGNKTYCRGCKKKCSGEVLRVNDVYFHNQCFSCKSCHCSLSQGGFFTKGKDYFCAKCYQEHFGTKCFNCNQYVEGEVVTALGKTYHQNCFKCAGCKKPFPTGERVTFTGNKCLCHGCSKNNTNEQDASNNLNAKITTNGVQEKTSKSLESKKVANNNLIDEDICAGCNTELKDGQALMALDKQYHVWCFKCHTCGTLLHGEYMGKDGLPYCEKDYQQLFGVRCTYCRRYISGKVLQAGDNNHFHPTCARCTKCGQPFGDGEEMFLQGAAIWHPRCGPGPDDSGIAVVSNGFDSNTVSMEPDGASMASAPFYGSRASSPGHSLRRDPYYDPRSTPSHGGRFSRSTTHMAMGSSQWYPQGGLYTSSSTYSLRRPIEPGDRIGSLANINHFHLPPNRRSSSASRHTPLPSNVPVLPGTPVGGRTSAAGGVDSGPPGPGGHFHRPISCPPKPGYTHARPIHNSAISPGPGMHFNDLNGQSDDVASQQSFRTDMTDPYSYLRPSNTYSHGFRTPIQGRPDTPGAFTGEHKTYPLHVLFTTNYKLPPDLDRCNLEKHLSDADFQIAFNMSRDTFYTLPLWKRNDMKKRVKLF